MAMVCMLGNACVLERLNPTSAWGLQEKLDRILKGSDAADTPANAHGKRNRRPSVEEIAQPHAAEDYYSTSDNSDTDTMPLKALLADSNEPSPQPRRTAWQLDGRMLATGEEPYCP